MGIKWVIDKIREKEGQFFYMYICNGNILFIFQETECMWLKRVSAHPALPVLYSSLGFYM